MRVVSLARAACHELPVDEQHGRIQRWLVEAGHDLVRLRAPRRCDWSSPGIVDVIEACRRGEVDVVAVVDLTRLGPSCGVVAAVLLLLESASVSVAIVAEDCTAFYSAGELWYSDAMAVARHALLVEERMAWGRTNRPSVIRLIGHSSATRRRA